MWSDFFATFSLTPESDVQEYILLAFAYVLGSIPFGLIIGRCAGIVDLRKVGSGNIGATNMVRAGGKWLGFLTLICDASKGTIAVLFAQYYYPYECIPLWCGILAVAGHIFPVWLKFKGGKGVATTLGVLFAYSWGLGLSAIAVWLVTFLFSRVSSLSAVLTMTAIPVLAFFFIETCGFGLIYTTLLLSAMVIYKHTHNIRRLVVGKEKPFEWNKK